MVYLIKSGELVKIGYARDVKARLYSMRTDNPHPLQVLAVFEGSRIVESRLHKCFAELRHFREWFRLEAPIRRLLRDSRRGALTLNDGTLLRRGAA